MTKYNGQTITYDAIGNPLSYRDGISLTWQNGRELASFTNADTSVSYTYDASGMRTSKTLTSDGATDTVKYVYENGLLLQMQYNHMYFDFIYDANGNPVSMAYRSTVTSSPIYYYYGLNSRGDVIALYYNTGAIAARYSYDVYGKLLGVTTSSGSQFTAKYAPAVLNPLRYRGYVYDNETGFYYLQSRYYDPTICRFVNADGYCSTGVGITGNNMFAYCNNNPVMCYDPYGNIHVKCCPSGNCNCSDKPKDLVSFELRANLSEKVYGSASFWWLKVENGSTDSFSIPKQQSSFTVYKNEDMSGGLETSFGTVSVDYNIGFFEKGNGFGVSTDYFSGAVSYSRDISFTTFTWSYPVVDGGGYVHDNFYRVTFNNHHVAATILVGVFAPYAIPVIAYAVGQSSQYSY